MIYWRATKAEVWFKGEQSDQLIDLRTGEQVPPMVIAGWVNRQLLADGYDTIEVRNDDRLLLRSYPARRH